jgi:uncharacterized protein YceH (UPF0502 family)
MLRGPQTPGELNQRSERLHRFEGLADVELTLETLVGRELVERQPRRPGQKEQRFRQLLGADVEPSQAFADRSSVAPEEAEDDERLAEVERALGELRDEVVALRAELALLRERRSAS